MVTWRRLAVPAGLVWAVTALAWATGGDAPGPAPGIEILSERVLPGPLRWARDVRWASDRSLFLTAGKNGVFELAAEGAEEPRLVIPGAGDGDGFWFSSRLAASAHHLVTAAPVGSYYWQDRRSPGTPAGGEHPFAVTIDLDLHRDLLAIFGADRDERGEWGRDGAVVWLRRLSGPPAGGGRTGAEGPAPLVFQLEPAGTEPRLRALAFCHFLELGALRFLADGSLLLVPGHEPGVARYDVSGRLLETWPTDGLDFEDRCELTREQFERLARDPQARWSWINQRRVLDEVLPLPEGPGLVLRSVRAGTTRWELVILGAGGGIEHRQLPVSSPSVLTHLKGDLRGDRLALLLSEDGLLDEPPAAPPRLLIARWRDTP